MPSLDKPRYGLPSAPEKKVSLDSAPLPGLSPAEKSRIIKNEKQQLDSVRGKIAKTDRNPINENKDDEAESNQSEIKEYEKMNKEVVDIQIEANEINRQWLDGFKFGSLNMNCGQELLDIFGPEKFVDALKSLSGIRNPEQMNIHEFVKTLEPSRKKRLKLYDEIEQLREKSEENLDKIPTEENQADFLTKVNGDPAYSFTVDQCGNSKNVNVSKKHTLKNFRSLDGKFSFIPKLLNEDLADKSTIGSFKDLITGLISNTESEEMQKELENNGNNLHAFAAERMKIYETKRTELNKKIDDLKNEINKKISNIKTQESARLTENTSGLFDDNIDKLEEAAKTSTRDIVMSEFKKQIKGFEDESQKRLYDRTSLLEDMLMVLK